MKEIIRLQKECDDSLKLDKHLREKLIELVDEISVGAVARSIMHEQIYRRLRDNNCDADVKEFNKTLETLDGNGNQH